MPVPFRPLIRSGSDSPAVATVTEGLCMWLPRVAYYPVISLAEYRNPAPMANVCLRATALVAFLLCFLEPQALGVVPPQEKRRK